MKALISRKLAVLACLFANIISAQASNTYYGSIDLYDANDISTFMPVEELEGNLILHFQELDQIVSLPNLKRIHGNIETAWGVRQAYRGTMQGLSLPNSK